LSKRLLEGKKGTEKKMVTSREKKLTLGEQTVPPQRVEGHEIKVRDKEMRSCTKEIGSKELQRQKGKKKKKNPV